MVRGKLRSETVVHRSLPRDREQPQNCTDTERPGVPVRPISDEISTIVAGGFILCRYRKTFARRIGIFCELIFALDGYAGA